jgi:DMSO reductase anchor subunit
MAYPQNFTPVFNQTTEAVHYNQTYVMDQTGYTPIWLFMMISMVAISLLVIAYKFKDEMAALLSIIFSLVAALTSRTIDVVTGYGATYGNSYVLLEQHVIYHSDMLTVIFAICFILSILNLYYIYLLSKIEGVENNGLAQRKRF